MGRILSDFRVWLSYRIPAGAMRVIRPFLTVQFLVFMLMGIINTGVSAGVATLLDFLSAHLLGADSTIRAISENSRLTFIIGYITSLITSFFLNSYFTFKQKPTLKRFIKFPVSYIPNFIFQYLMVFLFTALGYNATAAYITAAILGTPVTFIAMKIIVFQRKKTI